MLSNLLLCRPFRISDDLNRTFHLSLTPFPKNILSNGIIMLQVRRRAHLGLKELEALLGNFAGF